MQLVPCPKCAMPRSESDIAERPCPLCGYVLGQDVVPYVDEPVAVAEEPKPLPAMVATPPRKKDWTSLQLFCFILFTLMCGFALGSQFVKPKTVYVDKLIFPEAAKVDADAVHKPKPAPLVTNLEPVRELAPMPREVEVVVAAPPPPPAVALPGGVSLIRLDRPTEVYTMERIGEGNSVKLTGRVSKLVITGVDGGATVDATELETKTISFNGRIEGNATIKVRMPGGTLSFSKAISGGATIDASVPGGSISFSSPGGTVSGGAKLKLTGKSVWFHTRIDGGSDVDIIVSNGGGLRFLELAGGSKIRYRGEQPDQEVRISPGRIDDNSECKRLD